MRRPIALACLVLVLGTAVFAKPADVCPAAPKTERRKIFSLTIDFTFGRRKRACSANDADGDGVADALDPKPHDADIDGVPASDEVGTPVWRVVVQGADFSPVDGGPRDLFGRALVGRLQAVLQRWGTGGRFDFLAARPVYVPGGGSSAAHGVAVDVAVREVPPCCPRTCPPVDPTSRLDLVREGVGSPRGSWCVGWADRWFAPRADGRRGESIIQVGL